MKKSPTKKCKNPDDDIIWYEIVYEKATEVFPQEGWYFYLFKNDKNTFVKFFISKTRNWMESWMLSDILYYFFKMLNYNDIKINVEEHQSSNEELVKILIAFDKVKFFNIDEIYESIEFDYKEHVRRRMLNEFRNNSSKFNSKDQEKQERHLQWYLAEKEREYNRRKIRE